MGQAEGSIMAIIIDCHMARNMIAVDHMESPGIAIHIMDIVQSPGILMMPPPYCARTTMSAAPI
jgi:hypothetical protein